MKKILFVFLLFIYSPFSRMEAQNLSDAQIKQKISKVAASMKSMECDFTQTKHLKMLNDEMKSKGKMYYQQTDKLRWEYISPYTYVFILNKDKVFLKNNKRKDVIDVNQNKMFREIARIMMSSVVGTCLTDDRNFKTSITSTDTEWIASMVPVRKDVKQMFQKIILHFSKQKSFVTKVELLENNGDKTIIELKNVRTNETISSEIFAIN